MHAPQKGFQHKLAELMQDIDPAIFEICHNRVLTGPFAGMEIIRDEFWSDGNDALKILGLYEEELHGAIIDSILQWPKVVINVGCAGGYYAVGMARRLPEAKIFALDINPRQINTCLELATRNGVRERMEFIIGCKTPKELGLSDLEPRLYIMDVEGAELDLLRPDICWQLCNADIIVECHDFKEKMFIRESLTNRFTPTHNIEWVKAQPPNLDRPLLSFLDGEIHIVRALIFTEKRPTKCDWLVMRSKHNPVTFNN